MTDDFVGSNHPPAVSNEQRLDFLQAVERIDRRISQLGGEKGAMIKAAKAQGLLVDAARLAARLLKRDPDDVKDFLTEVIRDCGLRHVPVPDISDIDLSVSPEASHRDQLALAEQWGYNAGLNGVAIEENPVTDQTSDLWKRWNDMHGMGRAQAARIAGAEHAPATRDRPGRNIKGTKANGKDAAEVLPNSLTAYPEEGEESPPEPAARRGGRPKGSKNKPKATTAKAKAEDAGMPAH